MTHLIGRTLSSASRRAVVMCLASAAIMLPSTAQAKGTLADTVVEMSFSLDFSLSGVAQETVSNYDDPTVFTVDRFESVTVSSMGDADVVPNANDQELLFSVSNTGNDEQDYALSVETLLGSDFEAGNLEIYFLADDGDGVFQETENGQEFTLYDEARSQVMSEVDGIIWVSVRGDMPTQATMGAQSQTQVQLNATVKSPQDARDVTTDKTSHTVSLRSSSGDIGSGTTGSDIGQYNMAAANVEVMASFLMHDDTSADCADLSLLFNRGMAIPGACVEYTYTFNNSEGTMDLEDIAFSSVMDPNFQFMTAEVTGFSDGSLSLPTSNTDCAITTCQVAFNQASLPANTTANLRVRVKLK